MKHLIHICRAYETGDYTKGYIGVSEDAAYYLEGMKTLAEQGEEGAVFAAIRRYDDIKCYSMIFGTDKKIQRLARGLRPHAGMAWNDTIGGEDG